MGKEIRWLPVETICLTTSLMPFWISFMSASTLVLPFFKSSDFSISNAQRSRVSPLSQPFYVRKFIINNLKDGQLGLRDLQGRAESEASNTSSGNQNRHHEDLAKTIICQSPGDSKDEM